MLKSWLFSSAPYLDRILLFILYGVMTPSFFATMSKCNSILLKTYLHQHVDSHHLPVRSKLFQITHLYPKSIFFNNNFIMCHPKQLWYISVFRTCWWTEYHGIETVVVQNILLCFIIQQRIKLLRQIREILYPNLFNSK